MADIFNRVLANLKENQQNRLKGNVNCIPWSLPRFSTVLPGVQKKRYYIVTASSKVGKTKLADYLFMYEPYFFYKQNPNKIKLKIFYFSLELNKDEKIKAAISHKLYRDTGKAISPERLDSVFEDYILDSQTEDKIKSYDDFFKDFEEVVTFVDEVRNPFGIYKYMRDYANNNGCYIDKYGEVIDHRLVDSGNIEHIKRIDRYVPNDPDEYVIVLTDHVSLLTPENGKSLHESMSTFSTDYCIKMRNRWGYTVVNIQQQSAEKEKQQFTFKGESIEDKLMPSQDGLADNKTIGRDCDVMIGLFAPHRYNITKWEGFDVARLGDNFRELSIIFNRRGNGNISVPLYFRFTN